MSGTWGRQTATQERAPSIVVRNVCQQLLAGHKRTGLLIAAGSKALTNNPESSLLRQPTDLLRPRRTRIKQDLSSHEQSGCR